jgi:hypothetical protein
VSRHITVLTKLLFRRLTAIGDNTPGMSVRVLIIPRSVPETRNSTGCIYHKKRGRLHLAARGLT